VEFEANLAVMLVFQLSGLPPNWPTCDAKCDADLWACTPKAALFEPLVLDKNDFLARPTPRLIGVGDRVGRGVTKECYLVDLASSHISHACVSMN